MRYGWVIFFSGVFTGLGLACFVWGTALWRRERRERST